MGIAQFLLTMKATDTKIVPERLYRVRETLSILGLSRTELYLLASKGLLRYEHSTGSGMMFRGNLLKSYQQQKQ